MVHPRTSGCLVVMYHYVRTRTAPLTRGVRGLTVSAFESQLDELAAWGEPVCFEQVTDALAGRSRLPRRCYLLTFDDGLLDHAEIVAPILGDRRLRAIFFVPGRVLCEPRVLPAHQVHLLMSVLEAEALHAEVLDQAGRLSRDQSRTQRLDAEEAGRVYAYETPARARLKHLLTQVLPIPLRNQILADLFARHVGSCAEWARKWYMSSAQVADLAASGHTIGGHGYAHEPPARLSPDDLQYDIRRCARVLFDLLGPGARPFSYPFGSFNEGVIEAVRTTGFATGFSTQSRLLSVEDAPYALPRVDTIHVRHLAGLESPCPA